MKTRICLVLTVIFLFSCSENKTPEELYNEALHDETEIAKSEILLKNAIKQSPKEAKYRIALAEIYNRVGNADFAEKEFNKAIELGVIPSEFITLNAEILLQKAAYDQLLLFFSHLDETNVKLSPKQSLYRLISYLYKQEIQKAKQLTKTLENFENDHFKLLSNAFSLALEGRTEESAGLLNEIAVEDIPLEFSYFWGRYLASKLMHREALPYLEHYHSIRTKNGSIKLALAGSYAETEQFDRVIEVLQPIKVRFPNNGVMNTLMAISYFKKSKPEKASEHASKALNSGNNDVRNRIILGINSFRKKNFEQSFTQLKIAVNSLPSDHVVHQIFWAVRLELGKGAPENFDAENVLDLEPISLPLAINNIKNSIENRNIDKANEILNVINDLDIEDEYSRTKRSSVNILFAKQEGIEELYELYANTSDNSKTILLIKQLLVWRDYKRAEQQILKLEKNSTDFLNVALLRGLMHAKQGNNDKAITEFNRLLRKDPNNLYGNMYFANKAIKEGSYDKAYGYVEKVLENYPNYLPAIVLEQSILLRLNKSKEAIEKAISQLKSKGLSQTVQLEFIKSLQNHKKFELSIDYLQSIVPDTFNLKLYFLLRANYALHHNDINQALEEYEEWFKKSQNPEAIYRKLHLLEQSYKYSEALIEIDRLLAINPNSSHMLALRAHYLVLSGEPQLALEVLETLDNFEVIKSTTDAIRGKALLASGRFQESESYIIAEYQRRPTRFNMYAVYRLYAATDRYQECIKLLSSYLANNKNDLTMHLLLAEKYEQTGDVSASIITYKNVLSLDEENLIALNNIANSYLNNANADKALSYIERAMSLYGKDSGDIVNTYGNTLLILKRYEDAAMAFEQSIKLKPGNDSFRLDAALAYAKLGKREKAEELLQGLNIEYIDQAKLQEVYQLID